MTGANFDLLSAADARKRLLAARQTAVRAEYLSYVDKLTPGQVGRLIPSADETVGQVRTRLSTAIRASGKKVIIRRAADELLFWLDEPGEDAAIQEALDLIRAGR